MKSPDKALAVLSKLRGLPSDHPYVRDEMEGIILQLEEERASGAHGSSISLIKEAICCRPESTSNFSLHHFNDVE